MPGANGIIVTTNNACLVLSRRRERKVGRKKARSATEATMNKGRDNEGGSKGVALSYSSLRDPGPVR